MRMTLTSLAAVLVLATAGLVAAADYCTDPASCTPAAIETCDPGGYDPGCQAPAAKPGCVVVVEMKKVKKHVWVVECEEHCPSLPGSRLLGGCRDSCCGASKACIQPAACGSPCGTCGPCAAVEARAAAQCPPRCSHERCRKVLKRKEIECEVPVYKCVPAAQAGCPASAEGCRIDPPADGATTMRYDRSDVAPLPPIVGTAYLE